MKAPRRVLPPVYFLGYLFAAILLGRLSAFLAPLAMCRMLQLRFIPAAEAMMASTFGDSYRQYQSRVRRWM